jgi:hypothetical protein
MGKGEGGRKALRVRIDETTGCWEWLGCVQANGYGRIRLGDKTDYVHRHVYKTFYGPIPEGHEVCHKCDNRKCCNPLHLFLGTRDDNMKDAMRKGRLSSGMAHAVLVFGEKAGMAKLNWEKVKVIRESKEKNASLARKFGVSKSTIGLIKFNKIWKEEYLGQ